MRGRKESHYIGRDLSAMLGRVYSKEGGTMDCPKCERPGAFHWWMDQGKRTGECECCDHKEPATP